MNLFDLAEKNWHYLKEVYREKKYRDKINDFVEFIKNNWAISIKMRKNTLICFLSGEEYKNIRRIKKELQIKLKDQKNLKISLNDAIEKHTKEYHKPRLVFESSFQNGEEFKYAALNVGGINVKGLGPKKYGEFCVVINQKQLKKYSTLAFIKEDSLKYIRERQIEIERFKKDIANRDTIHFLTALKHCNIDASPKREWPSKICCNERYIEAITIDSILNKHMETVRISAKDYDYYYVDLGVKMYQNTISDTERHQFSLFKSIVNLLRKQGLELERIEENED
ncbi:MAG: hypothetical protein ACFFC7_29825 [Candidatus Hermodarchaeota archaeon]